MHYSDQKQKSYLMEPLKRFQFEKSQLPFVRTMLAANGKSCQGYSLSPPSQISLIPLTSYCWFPGHTHDDNPCKTKVANGRIGEHSDRFRGEGYRWQVQKCITTDRPTNETTTSLIIVKPYLQTCVIILHNVIIRLSQNK